MVEIARISAPTTPVASRAMKAAGAYQRSYMVSVGGHGDAVPSATTLTKAWLSHPDWVRFLAFDRPLDVRHEDGLAILPGSADSSIEITGTVIGSADVYTDPARIIIAADTDEALQALWAAVSPLITGPCTALATAPLGEDLHLPGGHTAASTRTTDLLAANGFTLTGGTTEFHLDVTKVADLASEVTKDPDYRLVQWKGEVPQVHKEAFRALSAGQDSKYVRLFPEHVTKESPRLITTAAQHIETGTIVGYSTLAILPGEISYEDQTVVSPDHQGKGLGLRMKVANIAHLKSLAPEQTHVLTWAEENSNLQGANTLLGYSPICVRTIWNR